MAAAVGEVAHDRDDLGRLNGSDERTGRDEERGLADVDEKLRDRTDPFAPCRRQSAISVLQARSLVFGRTVAQDVELH
jgi:hypothetical protein